MAKICRERCVVFDEVETAEIMQKQHQVLLDAAKDYLEDIGEDLSKVVITGLKAEYAACDEGAIFPPVILRYCAKVEIED